MKQAAVLFVGLVACAPVSSPRERLTLATTTSVRDSGLLERILPDFEQESGARVAVVAVGSGQALEIARRGDADALIVHSPEAEEKFMREGHGVVRRRIMRNYFAIVGPESDPAEISVSANAAEAFRRIARARAPFVSRGDDSGTHAKERQLWRAAGVDLDSLGPWYKSVGSGMAATLRITYELDAYTLTDEGTYRSLPDIGELARTKPGLMLLVGGLARPRADLENVYSVIVVNPERHPHTNAPVARRFASWITSEETADRIRAFVVNGHPIFLPVARRS